MSTNPVSSLGVVDLESKDAAKPELSPLQLHTTMSPHRPELSPTLSPDRLRPEKMQVEIERHPKWFWDEGTVKFLVEDTLYKLLKRTFLRSSRFQDLFNHAASPRMDPQLLPGWEPFKGSRDTHFYVNWDRRQACDSKRVPILYPKEGDVFILPDVTKREFDSLLSVLYPDDVDQGGLTAQEECIGVLKLATRWAFADARRRAIRELFNRYTTPTERLTLAREYDIQEWIEPALATLCTNMEPLSSGDLAILHPGDAALVIKIRENARKLIHPADSEEGAKKIADLLEAALHNGRQGTSGQNEHDPLTANVNQESQNAKKGGRKTGKGAGAHNS